MSTAHGSVRKHGLPTATQQREYGYVAHVCHTPTQGLAEKLAAREASDATHPATFGVGSPPVLLPDHPASRRVTMRVNVSGSAALGDQTHTDGGLECSIRQSMQSRALPSSSIWQTFLSLLLMLGLVCCFGGRCLFGSSASSDTSNPPFFFLLFLFTLKVHPFVYCLLQLSELGQEMGLSHEALKRMQRVAGPRR